MMNIHDIIAEINIDNSSNNKLATLKKHSDNEFLQKILKMTYDSVAFTYGVSLKQISNFEPNSGRKIDLDFAVDALEYALSTRDVTGHEACQLVADLIANLNDEDANLIKQIINRDLRINVGKTQINKVWKGLITKPVYMRCDIYSEKTAKNIDFPAPVQLKADGTYREMKVHDKSVTSRSRSGEPYEYPLIFNQMQNYPDGYTFGELTVKCNDAILNELLPKLEKSDKKYGTEDAKELTEAYQSAKSKGEEYILPRSLGNGLINSDSPPHDNIYFDVWDYLTLDEYDKAAKKDKENPCLTPYSERWAKLQEILETNQGTHIALIDCLIVNNVQEALQYCSTWMNKGYEGAVLKDFGGVFKDGTPNYQLKLKLEISLEVRITGTNDGKVGTKREGKVGSIEFQNDEGTIKGNTSGFSDKQMDEFTAIRNELPGSIMTVECNDLTKGRGNSYYALSHPRFIEIRKDRDDTDTLERAFKLRESAMQLTD
jgi:DNA ligase-1